jgi:acyl-CoA reductase-like NAD-dependent aldehyde dehydrogenase
MLGDQSRVHASHSTSLIPTSWAYLVIIMSERQPRPYDEVARKWHALAERRRAHLADLRDSDRWRRYYTWEAILEAVREAAQACDTWARLAGLPEGETPNPMGGAVVNAASDNRGEVLYFRKAG